MTNEQHENISILEQDAEQKWNQLQISNDFIFNKLMQNPKLCKRILEIVLEVTIDHIEYPETEKTMKMTKDGKGIRLDVYVADANQTIYNVEMQAADKGELPKRSRYYQGVIDMDIINKGQLYNTLKASYVIFICRFDLFKAGLYKYTFENLCREEPSIALGDETQKIFLNAKAIMDDLDVDEDLKAFLAYVDGKESENEFVQELEEEIEKIKGNENWRKEYMMQHINDQSKIEEGKKIGKKIGDLSRLILQIKKKIQKLKSLEIIADEMECEPEEIEVLYEVIQKCGVEASVEEILEEVMNNK